MRKLIASTVLVAGLATPALAAAGTGGGAAPTTQADKSIVQTTAADGRFTTLVSLVKRAGLVDALAGENKLTVFAPTNAAFKKVPKATLKRLLGDRAQLRRVLLYHVVAGDVKAQQVVQLRRARTLAGPSVRIRVRDGKVYLNNSRTKVVQTDVAATNGTIHVINRVLLPPGR
jgi:uncharacterized surface protein with fasciclin (FAS1) repeats